MISTSISDKTTSITAKVTPQGRLVTGPLEFSTPKTITLETANTPLELLIPKTGKIIIITDLILYANKNVGATDATVTLYESENSATTKTSADKTVFQQEMVKQTSLPLTGLNWQVSEGKFLNGVTDDDDIFVNISYYYADA